MSHSSVGAAPPLPAPLLRRRSRVAGVESSRPIHKLAAHVIRAPKPSAPTAGAGSGSRSHHPRWAPDGHRWAAPRGHRWPRRHRRQGSSLCARWACREAAPCHGRCRRRRSTSPSSFAAGAGHGLRPRRVCARHGQRLRRRRRVSLRLERRLTAAGGVGRLGGIRVLRLERRHEEFGGA